MAGHLVLAGAALLSLWAGSVSAQVTTSCQPLNTTNCPADPALGTDFFFNFNSTPSSDAWTTTAGTVPFTAADGATFTINKQGDSPTIRSTFYIFFGRTEISMKVASGTGIISSVMFLSDDLDEIDWEFMGGNASFAETNYFGKGRQDFNNAIYYPVAGGAENDYHNYTSVWTNTSLEYYVDGTKVRTLLPKDANNTNNYPQTPMRISIGIWAGGDPTLPKGTREWAGGDTDYSKGPFSMFVKSVRVSDYSSGKEYSYGDMTGSWESIKIASGNSTAATAINTKPAETLTLSQKWARLSTGAHIAVYASAGAVGALLFSLLLYYCIRQRRLGAEENRQFEARMARERMELAQLQKDGINPDSFAASPFNARDVGKDTAQDSVYGLSHSATSSTADLVNEKAWGAAGVGAGMGAAAAAMRSPVPLLQSGARSPSSPQPHRGMFGGDGGGRMASPAPLAAPQPTRSPGQPPSYALPPSPGYPGSGGGGPNGAGMRSASGPAATMRAGSASPGPGMLRTQSPAAGYNNMSPRGGAPAAPMRSYTASPQYGSGAPGAAGGRPNYGGANYDGGFGGSFDNNYWR